jgi:hypothetical protein
MQEWLVLMFIDIYDNLLQQIPSYYQNDSTILFLKSLV